MRQLLRRNRPKLRERIAEGQMGDEFEEVVRGGLVFLISIAAISSGRSTAAAQTHRVFRKGSQECDGISRRRKDAKKEIGAVEGTRTPTGFHPPAPKAGASANSATTAGGYFNSSAGHFRDVYEFRSTKPSPGGTAPAGRWPKKTTGRIRRTGRQRFSAIVSHGNRPQMVVLNDRNSILARKIAIRDHGYSKFCNKLNAVRLRACSFPRGFRRCAGDAAFARLRVQ